MPFIQESTANPALQLHHAYNVMTNGRSDLKFWKQVVSRYDLRDALAALRYLEHNYCNYPRLTLDKFKEIVGEARKDPVASRYPVSEQATEIGNDLDSMRAGISPEYIQQALDHYRVALEIIKTHAPELWIRMPAPAEYVFNWFDINAAVSSERYRAFSPTHIKFHRELASVSRTYGVATPSQLTAIITEIKAKFDGKPT